MVLELHKCQKLIAEDNHRYRILVCGRKFGKTTLAVYEILGKAVAQKDRQIAYLASTYGEARDIAWASLIRIAKPVIIGKPNESRLEVVVKTQDGGRSIIYLKGWESVETMRGMEFDLLVPDEVQNYKNFWMYWQEVLRPTLIPRRGNALLMGTPKGFNHVYDLFNKESEDPDYKSFHFTTYDNPYVPPEEIEKIKKELTEDRFAQEVMGDFRKTEGLVYKEFRREVHLYTELPHTNFTDTLLGVDFGYTNPACVLRILKDQDNNYWVADEWYKSKQTTAQIVEVCKQFKGNIVYPDPAEPDRIAEMTSAGLNCREVSKDIPAGINQVREMFKQNRLHIHPNCKNLIWELETYAYPERKPDHNEEEKPVKENDHAVDALRYVIYSNIPVINKTNIYIPIYD